MSTTHSPQALIETPPVLPPDEKKYSSDQAAVVLSIPEPSQIIENVNRNSEPSNPHLSAFLNGTFPVQKRVFPDMTNRIPSVSSVSEISRVTAVITNINEDDTVRHEAIELLRRSNVSNLHEVLHQAFANERNSPRFRRFLAQHLGICLSADTVGAQYVLPILRNALNDECCEVRRESLLALAAYKDAVARSFCSKLIQQKDAPQEMLDAVIRAIFVFDDRKHTVDIREKLLHADEDVQIAAIYTLSCWNDVDSQVLFLKLGNSPVRRVASAAKSALLRMESNRNRNLEKPQIDKINSSIPDF